MNSYIRNNYFMCDSADIEVPDVVNEIIDNYFSEKIGWDKPECCRKRCPACGSLEFDEIIGILQGHEDKPEVASYLDKLYAAAIRPYFREKDGWRGLMVDAINNNEFVPQRMVGDIEDNLDDFLNYCMQLPREKAVAILAKKHNDWTKDIVVYRERECFSFEIDIEYIPMPKVYGPKADEIKKRTFEVSECLGTWLKVDYGNDVLNSSEYLSDDRFEIDCDYNQDDQGWMNEEFQEFLDKVYAECYFHPTKGRDILQQKEKIWLVRDLGDSYYRPQKSFGDFKREEQLPLIGTSLLHFDEEKCWNRYLDYLLPEYRKFFENLSDEERYNRYQIPYYDWKTTRIYDWKAIDIRPKNI